MVKRIVAVAYELDLPPNTQAHPVFHVSLLKKFASPVVSLNPTSPIVDDQGQFMLEPEEILGRKIVKHHNLHGTQDSLEVLST